MGQLDTGGSDLFGNKPEHTPSGQKKLQCVVERPHQLWKMLQQGKLDGLTSSSGPETRGLFRNGVTVSYKKGRLSLRLKLDSTFKAKLLGQENPHSGFKAIAETVLGEQLNEKKLDDKVVHLCILDEPIMLLPGSLLYLSDVEFRSPPPAISSQDQLVSEFNRGMAAIEAYINSQVERSGVELKPCSLIIRPPENLPSPSDSKQTIFESLRCERTSKTPDIVYENHDFRIIKPQHFFDDIEGYSLTIRRLKWFADDFSKNDFYNTHGVHKPIILGLSGANPDLIIKILEGFAAEIRGGLTQILQVPVMEDPFNPRGRHIVNFDQLLKEMRSAHSHFSSPKMVLHAPASFSSAVLLNLINKLNTESAWENTLLIITGEARSDFSEELAKRIGNNFTYVQLSPNWISQGLREQFEAIKNRANGMLELKINYKELATTLLKESDGNITVDELIATVERTILNHAIREPRTSQFPITNSSVEIAYFKIRDEMREGRLSEMYDDDPGQW